MPKKEVNQIKHLPCKAKESDCVKKYIIAENILILMYLKKQKKVTKE